MIAPVFRVNGVHDGDTVYLDVQLHGTTWLIGEKMRIAGVQCPELNTPGGPIALAFTREWLDKGDYHLDLRPKRDKYGRLLGNLIRGEDSLKDQLLSSGNAVAYRELEIDG